MNDGRVWSPYLPKSEQWLGDGGSPGVDNRQQYSWFGLEIKKKNQLDKDASLYTEPRLTMPALLELGIRSHLVKE